MSTIYKLVETEEQLPDEEKQFEVINVKIIPEKVEEVSQTYTVSSLKQNIADLEQEKRQWDLDVADRKAALDEQIAGLQKIMNDAVSNLELKVTK